MRLKHKVFSWMLLFSMLVGPLPQITVPVFAADESSYKQMTMYDQNSTTPISITENTVLTLGGTNTITSTGSPIQLADGVTLSIVMSEGSETTLTCTATEADVDSVQGKTAGIYVPKTATLNIRNADDSNPGKLTVKGGYGGAGIGSGSAATAYEDKDMGKAGDGSVGKAVSSAGVSSTVKSAGSGWTYIYGVHGQKARNAIQSIPDWVLNYAKSLAPTDMKDVLGGSGGTHGRNALDNTQDCGTVVIKGGTIYSYGGQGGAGIGGGSGVNGENGATGEDGKVSDGTAYGETSKAAVMRGADGYRITVKSSVAGSSGGGAGGNGGQGGRGSNGGNVTIDGGNIIAIGGKNGTATAAGIGGGAGGTGGNGGNGGNGGSPDSKGVAGRGADGQAGYGGTGGNSGDAGTLTINGGKVISKGNNGFGVGNYGTVGSDGKTRGQSKTGGTAGGNSWVTSWDIVQEDPNNHAYIAATAVYDYTGVGGDGGDGGQSTAVSSVSGNLGTAGTNTINKTDSNVVFMDESGNISSKNLPTNGNVELYEYNLKVITPRNEPIESASVKVRDANGNVIAQSISRTTEEENLINSLINGDSVSTYSSEVAKFANAGNASRYSTGVATLWLPAGTYTLSGDDVSIGKTNLGYSTREINVVANPNGEGGSGSIAIGDAKYKTEITVKDLSKYNEHPLGTGANVAGAILTLGPKNWDDPNEDKRLGLEPAVYKADENGKVVIELPIGTYVFKGDYVTDSSGTKKIPGGMEQKITVKADDYNKAVIWIGDKVDVSVNLNAETFDAADAKKFTYPNATVNSNIKIYSMDVNIENAGKFANLTEVKASDSAAIITAADQKATWIWQTPKDASEVEAILKQLQFLYEDSMKITVEVNGNATVIPWATNNTTNYEETDHRWTKVVNAQSDKTWDASYTQAKASMWKGRQGYLANITSVEEQTLINSKFTSSDTSIGGTSLLDATTGEKMIERDAIKSGDWKGVTLASSQEDKRLQFYWAAGPERGDNPPAEIMVKSEGFATMTNAVMGTLWQGGSWVRTEGEGEPAFLVEYGGYTEGNDPGGYLKYREATDVVEPGVREYYRYYLTVYDRETGEVVPNATIDASAFASEQSTYTTGEDGVAILWLKSGNYEFTGSMIKKDTKQIPSNSSVKISVRKDNFNAGSAYISDKATSLKVNLGTWAFDAIDGTRISFPDVAVTAGESGEAATIQWMKVTSENVGYIRGEGLTGDADVVYTKNSDGNTNEATWYFTTPKTTQEVTEILKKLSFIYVDNATTPMRVRVEVDGNTTTANMKGKEIFELNGHYYIKSASTKYYAAAYTDAKSYIYRGRRGYIANLTSEEERKLMQSKLSSGTEFWAGAVALVDKTTEERMLERNTLTTSDYKTLTYPGSVDAYKDMWYYMAGPEAGETVQADLWGTNYPASGHWWSFFNTNPSYNMGLRSYVRDGWSGTYFVEFGGYNDGNDAGGYEAVNYATDVSTPEWRGKVAYNLTVRNIQTGEVVPGATIDAKNMGGERETYTTGEDGTVKMWIDEGRYILTGSQVKDNAGNQIPDGKQVVINAKADTDNVGYVSKGYAWIGKTEVTTVKWNDKVDDPNTPGKASFPNVEVTSEKPIKTVVVSTNKGQIDQTTATVQSTYKDTTQLYAIWVFEQGKTAEEVKDLLKSLKFDVESDMKVQVRVDSNETKTPAASEVLFYNNPLTGGNGHFYIKLNTKVNWYTAYANAKAKVFAGHKGYIANINDVQEQKFFKNVIKPANYSWLGGTVLVDKTTGFVFVDPLSISASDYKDNGVREKENFYYATGPEAGEKAKDFWGGSTLSRDVNACIDIGTTGEFYDDPVTYNAYQLIEFGGYDEDHDPGAWYSTRHSTDTADMDMRRDQNGTLLYKYVAVVKDSKTSAVVPGATIKIKVPSPDGDESKAYIYNGNDGVLTDENGEAVLWLPKGTYTPTGNDVFKEGIGGLVKSLDATFTVTETNSEKQTFWLGEVMIGIQWNQQTVFEQDGQTLVKFENPTMNSELVVKGIYITLDSGIINNIDNVSPKPTMKDEDKQTAVWIKNEGFSQDEILTLLKQLEFTYEKGQRISVEIDSNDYAGNFEGREVKSYEDTDGMHYYMSHVSYLTDWAECYNTAKNFTLGGRKGYLVSITSTGEFDRIKSRAKGYVGATAIRLYEDNAMINDIDYLDKSKGHNLFAYNKSVTTSMSGSRYNQYWYWSSGPDAGQSVDMSLWKSGEPSQSRVTPTSGNRKSIMNWNIEPRTNEAYACVAWFYANQGMMDWPVGEQGGFWVEFGGYREGQDPGGRLEIRTASDVRIINDRDAYYTYTPIMADGTEVDEYDSTVTPDGYKIGVTPLYKEAIVNNTAFIDWVADASLMSPTNEDNVDAGCYTYNGKTLPIISTEGMFAETSDTASGFNNVEKLDLSLYDLPQLDTALMSATFTNTGKATDGFPAVGLANAAEAAKFNDEAQTGIDKTKLYFGNVTKVEGETQPGYRYGDKATSIELETAGVESYTITGTGGTETLTEADFGSDPYTFDLNQVFNDTDKTNATAGSLRTTVTIVKVMAQQNLGVEAYFNGDMTTDNPSAAIMRGAWANESDGYVDFYVRDVGNADGKISVENLKKLKVTANLSYGFENVAAFQTGDDAAEWYKNILESDLAMYLVKADGTETDIATLISENNTNPIVFAPAVDNSKPETEDKTEAKDNTADDTEDETSGTTDETTPADGEQTTESADTATDGELGSDSNSADENADADVTTDANADENTAEEPKAEEATEPKAEEETENADVSTFSSEDDIALMALTYLDDAEIVTFTDALGNEQKYTRIRVKVSNVLASGIVTFKLSYNTGTDADTGEAVYEAINSAEYDVIVPGDVDKDGVVSNDDSLLCIKIGSGILSADEGRTGNYLFELADLDRDHVISNDDALNCVKIGSGLLSISNK